MEEKLEGEGGLVSEPEPTEEVPLGVRIEGLSKAYKGSHRGPDYFAVRHLDLNLYQGQITAFLGHNGAGGCRADCNS